MASDRQPSFPKWALIDPSKFVSTSSLQGVDLSGMSPVVTGYCDTPDTQVYVATPSIVPGVCACQHPNNDNFEHAADFCFRAGTLELCTCRHPFNAGVHNYDATPCRSPADYYNDDDTRIDE